MVRKKSKKKRPKKEVKVIKPEQKIEARVFDRATLKIISKFMSKKLFDILDTPIKMGKEANVFRAVKLKNNKPFKYYAVKIYRIETTSFKKMEPYIYGDPRFKKVKRTRFEFMVVWTRKEYINLKKAYLAGVSVPEPVAYHKNVVVMEFIGENGVPFPTLNMCKKEELAYFGTTPKKLCRQIFDNIKKLYNAGLVHADFSMYNVMLTRDKPVLIDMSQSVILKHPSAHRFLEKDMENYLKMCKKFGVDMQEQVKDFCKSKCSRT